MAVAGESLTIPGTPKPAPVVLNAAMARATGGNTPTKKTLGPAGKTLTPTPKKFKPKATPVAKPRPVAKAKPKATAKPKAKAKPRRATVASGPRKTTTTTTTTSGGADPSLPSWYQAIINADNKQTLDQANALKALTTQNYNSINQQSTQEQQQLANLAKASGQAWGAGAQMPGVPGDISALMNQTNATIGADQATVPLVGLNSQAASLLANEPYALSTLYGRNAAAQAKLASTYGAELMKTGSAAAIASANQTAATNRTKIVQTQTNLRTQAQIDAANARSQASNQLRALQLQIQQQNNLANRQAKKAAASAAVYNRAVSDINKQSPHIGGLPQAQQAPAMLQLLQQYNLNPTQEYNILRSHLSTPQVMDVIFRNRGTLGSIPAFRTAMNKALAMFKKMQVTYKTAITAHNVAVIAPQLAGLVGASGAYWFIQHLPNGGPAWISLYGAAP